MMMMMMYACSLAVVVSWIDGLNASMSKQEEEEKREFEDSEGAKDGWK